MEIPFGISISIIKVKHWPAYRTQLESADSIFSAADLEVQFLGEVTDRYSEIKGVILWTQYFHGKNTCANHYEFSIFHVKLWSAYGTWLESGDSNFRSAEIEVQFLSQVTCHYLEIKEVIR